MTDFERGAEAMREACATLAHESDKNGGDYFGPLRAKQIRDAIRLLPLPVQPPGSESREARLEKELKLYQLFVLAAHWVIYGLHKDVEASEPAVLLCTPLRMAARKAINAFQPPGTVRSFTGAEGFALHELDEATRALEPVPSRPLAGEAGEWWQAALTALDLPSIPFGESMDYLRRAIEEKK